MYKFQPKGVGSMGKNNMKMKGSPIPLEYITLSHLHQVSHGDVAVVSVRNGNGNRLYDTGMTPVDSIPTNQNCNGYFSISSADKTNFYATTSQLDAQTWINVLHNARQECITTKMGHSKKPISREVDYVNRMGKRIVEQKKRISDLIRKKELEEVELICLQGGGSAGTPRGYFG